MYELDTPVALHGHANVWLDSDTILQRLQCSTGMMNIIYYLQNIKLYQHSYVNIARLYYFAPYPIDNPQLVFCRWVELLVWLVRSPKIASDHLPFYIAYIDLILRVTWAYCFKGLFTRGKSARVSELARFWRDRTFVIISWLNFFLRLHGNWASQPKRGPASTDPATRLAMAGISHINAITGSGSPNRAAG